MISTTFWRLLISILIVIVVIGAGLALLLANGLANPPTTGLVSSAQSRPNPFTPPFTIQLENEVQFSLTCDTQLIFFRVHDDGYFSVDSGLVDWRGFHHIQRGTNTLYLYIDADYRAVFRINREIAWVSVVESDSCIWQIES